MEGVRTANDTSRPQQWTQKIVKSVKTFYIINLVQKQTRIKIYKIFDQHILTSGNKAQAIKKKTNPGSQL